MDIWCEGCASYHESLTFCPRVLSGNDPVSITVPSPIPAPRCAQDRQHDDMGCEVAWEMHCDRHRRETRAVEKKLADANLQNSAYFDQIEWAWSIIASAGPDGCIGNWQKMDPKWTEAAEKWRDKWYEFLGKRVVKA